MALFTKDTGTKTEPLPKASPQPSMPPAPASTAATAPMNTPEKTIAPPRPAPLSTSAGAYLDAGTKISGKLVFDGPTKIDGQVDGEITAKDNLTIGESAVVTAQIKAASIIVAGKISGDITAVKRIEIRPSAKVIGNLTAPILVVHEGATFEGHCAMSSDGSREEHKVTMFPKEERMNQAAGQKLA